MTFFYVQWPLWLYDGLMKCIYMYVCNIQWVLCIVIHCYLQYDFNPECHIH